MPDKLLRITTDRAAFRCVVSWMPETAKTLVEQHGPSPEMGEYLANLANGALLLASNLKGPGAVSLRLESGGLIGLMNADATPEGLVRAMIARANIRDEGLGRKLNLPIIGPGTLSVMKNYTDHRKPYTGVTELRSPHIGPIIADYLLASEQVKSSVSAATVFDKGKISVSCGFLIEVLPDLKEVDLEKMENNVKRLGNFRAFIRALGRPEELAEELLSGFSYEVLAEIPVRPHCPCSTERLIRAIMATGENEIQDILKVNKALEVFCDYCRKQYLIYPDDIRKALKDETEGAGLE